MYQLLCIDLSEYAFGKVYSDGEIEIIFKDTSLIASKHRQGGQSALRFQKNRDNAITEYFKEINERLKNVDGEVILGINSVYYNRFIENLNTYNQQKIKEQRGIEYSGVTGVYQMLSCIEKEKNKKN